jgi:molecular chaperone HscA
MPARRQGRLLLPSVVRYLDGGRPPDRRRGARHQAEDPENTIVSVKRFMGRGWPTCRRRQAAVPLRRPARHGGHRHARRREDAGRGVGRDPGHLRQRAEDTFDDDLFGAVITVPAYFDDAQRQATKDAAQLAG